MPVWCYCPFQDFLITMIYWVNYECECHSRYHIYQISSLIEKWTLVQIEVWFSS
jgi:hypothetical protein